NSNVFAYIVARAAGNNAYRTTIRVSNTGSVFIKLTKVLNNTQSDVKAEVNTGVTLTPGALLGFRFQIVGSHLQFRVRNTRGPEPSTWNSEADDSSLASAGSVGLRAYINSNVPNGPVHVSFENYEVRVP